MAMHCAFYVVVHMVVRNMDHNMAAVLGQGSSIVLHKVGIVVAVQPVQLVAQVVKVWSVVASLLPEVARLDAPLCLLVLLIDYS
jgi:hypothetical protein